MYMVSDMLLFKYLLAYFVRRTLAHRRCYVIVFYKSTFTNLLTYMIGLAAWFQMSVCIAHSYLYETRPRSESESERQGARNGASESEGEFFPKRARKITSES